MGTVLLRPRGERLVVHICIGAVIEGRGGVTLHRVVCVQAAWDEAGVGRDFLADEVEGFVGAEAGGAVGEDLGEELLEEVVALEDSAAAVGGDVDNEFGFVVGNGLVD